MTKNQAVWSEEPTSVAAGRVNLVNVWFCMATVATVLLSINQIFNFGFFVGYVLGALNFYYLLMALMLPLLFLVSKHPAHEKSALRQAVDVVLAAAATASLLYLVLNADAIVNEAWEYNPPPMAIVVSFAMWILALECTRRAGGSVLAVVAAVFSVYPIFGGYLPGPIQSQNVPAPIVATFYTMSSEGFMGIPMRAFAGLIIGFLVFGVALQKTGGGRFFMDLAFGMLGHTRGGPAKVAIIASGFMGSLSGSVVTNILTTGTLTIPAMRRIGISRNYAAGIEACASTGAVLMPPIMGATAFVMATFLEVDYAEIVIAAIIPSFLYFLTIFFQTDCYVARKELKGLDRSELPSIRATLLSGWYYVFVFALLVFMLLYMKREAMAPYYATVLLIAINQVLPGNRWRLGDVTDFIFTLGRILIELMGVLMGIGLIIGALSVTGLSATLTSDLIHIAGNNAVLLLAMGAIVSFILGMGMTVTAAYIFLAITLAPALVEAGMQPLAVHMFILYWGMLSYITPPVAIGAYAASSIAGSNPMIAGLTAMRIGSVIYILPFIFVLDPSLLGQGSAIGIASALSTAIIGVFLISAALQGYLHLVGNLDAFGWLGLPIRAMLMLGGLMFVMPDATDNVLGLDLPSQGVLVLGGTALTGLVYLFALVRKRSLRSVTS